MNFNEIYTSISAFWNSIFPVFLVHVLMLLTLYWVTGVRGYGIQSFEAFLSRNSYKRWRSVLDEFELRSKLPLIALVALILYLVVFNSLVIETISNLSITSFSYIETEFWEENREIDRLQLSEIAAYSGNPDISVWQIAELKMAFLNDFRTKYPELYKSSVGWLRDGFAKWQKHYETSIIFLIFLGILLLNRVFRWRHRTRPFILKLVMLFCLAFVWTAFSRYMAESYIEKQLRAELGFVVSQLRVGIEPNNNQLDAEEVEKITCEITRKYAHTSSPTLFWWSRTLEKYLPFEREFKAMSDEEFLKRYGNPADCEIPDEPQ